MYQSDGVLAGTWYTAILTYRCQSLDMAEVGQPLSAHCLGGIDKIPNPKLTGL